ncbi:MAG: type II toxin-antitoxin system RelE/ParE family toxin [Hyphomicrobium sp.]
MIVSFRSRALKKLWERDDPSKLPPDRIARITILLNRLDAAANAEDMNLPGFGFHRLAGSYRGRYAVSVSANWRITFGWQDQDAVDVDFEDYH